MSATLTMDVGVGLWTMRSTADAPASIPTLYRELQEDARLADQLGFHSLWLSEHHFWYDGWCPSPLIAGAAVLGATSRLHVGTGVLLLPLHDPHRLATAGHTLERLAPGRTELGIGLGYRDAEFDGHGVSRRRRGRLADVALDVLTTAWSGAGPRLWIGGLAQRSLNRGASRGLGLFLPSSMHPEQLRRVIARAREAALAHGTALGRVAVLKNSWVTDGTAKARARATARICEQAREYGGAWWLIGGRLGFDTPELLDEQMARNGSTAIVGPPEMVSDQLHELAELGVDLVVLHIATEDVHPAHREVMARIAEEVVPALR